MDQHQDFLDDLNFNAPLREKLRRIHTAARRRVPVVDRVSVAVYDRKTDFLASLADSSDVDQPLEHYEAHLSDAPSLREIFTSGRPRLVRDLEIFRPAAREHTRRLLGAGYHTSYALPLYNNGVFLGFVFFNSHAADAFDAQALEELDVFGHLIALLVANEIGAIDTLLAALKTAREITHQRDTETAEHLERMARYARAVAQELAPRYGFDDDYIEHVFLFAPLHDIGKIAIPDRVLQKDQPLNDEEYAIMKSHVEKGRQMVDAILRNFGLDSFRYVDVLRNITEYHHEKVNGTGYPHGLVGADIPVEARIVAVADVFDALTSRRHYKTPWTNDEAFAALDRMAGTALDARCVAALKQRRAEIEEIQARFKEPSPAAPRSP